MRYLDKLKEKINNLKQDTLFYGISYIFLLKTFFILIIKLLRNYILIIFFFIFLLTLFIVMPVGVIVLLIFLLLLIGSLKLFLRYKLVTIKNKVLLFFLNKNYLYIIYKIIGIKIILLAGYSLDFSFCDSTFNKVSHNVYLTATHSVGLSSVTSNQLLQGIGLIALVGGVSYIAYNSFKKPSNNLTEIITPEQKAKLFKADLIVLDCLNKKDYRCQPLNYIVNRKFYGSNIYQNEMMKQHHLGSFKRSYSDTLLPALAEKPKSCSIYLEPGNIINIYNVNTDHSFRHMFHGHTTEVVLKVVHFGIIGVLNNTITGMSLCELLEIFGIKSLKPKPEDVGQKLVFNIYKFLEQITNDFEKK